MVASVKERGCCTETLGPKQGRDPWGTGPRPRNRWGLVGKSPVTNEDKEREVSVVGVGAGPEDVRSMRRKCPTGHLVLWGQRCGGCRHSSGDGPLAGVEAPKPPRLTLIAWAQTPSPKCSPSPRSECFRGCLWTRHRGEGPGHGWTGKEDTGGVKGNPPPRSV